MRKRSNPIVTMQLIFALILVLLVVYALVIHEPSELTLQFDDEVTMNLNAACDNVRSVVQETNKGTFTYSELVFVCAGGYSLSTTAK